MDVDEDIVLIKKLQSIDEHDRAVSLCKYLLGFSSVKNGGKQKIDIGNLLATSLIALSIEEAEENNLFELLLSLGRRKEAAKWLLGKAINSGLAEDFVRVADLFSLNTDPEILRTVNEAFEAIFGFDQEEFTPDVEALCDRHMNYLISNDVSPELIEEFLKEYWYSSNVDGHRLLTMLLGLMDSRNEIDPWITYLLARCYGYLREYEDALKTLLPLLVDDSGEDRIYMLSYAGDWFLKLNKPEDALLFLKGVIDAPDSAHHKYAVEKAAQTIKAIEDASSEVRCGG